MSRQAFPARAVGKPIERVEDYRLLCGLAEFVDDVHADRMLHAVIARSSVAHGRIRSIDGADAANMPGVRGVYTAREVEAACRGRIPTIPMRRGKLEGLEPFEQPVIAADKVRYVGEPVAVVVADSQAEAEDALASLVLDIDPLPAVADRDGSEGGASPLFEHHGSNLAITYVATKGNVAAVRAPYVRRERFSVQRHTAVSMEPRGLVAIWDSDGGGRLRVIGAAKSPFATRRILAQQLGVPQDSIEMIECDVGGGFGVRGDFYPEDFLIPFASRMSGCPVKWIEDRLENLIASSHARDADCEIEIACERDGTIVALQGRIRYDMGAYIRNAAEVGPRNSALLLSAPYRIPNIRVETALLVTNKSPLGVYRGPGRFEADFFRERLFDMAARDLGIDRVEFRRRNLVREDEMPYTISDITPAYGEPKAECDGGNYHLALDRCLSEIDWQAKSELDGTLIDGRYHGLGVGCFIEGGGGGPGEYARISLAPDGTISVFVGSSNVGQGVKTFCTQIAADALACDVDRIQVYQGSTIYLKNGVGSFASRSVVNGGSAILDAASKLKEALSLAAALRFNCAPAEVVVGEGLSVSHGDRTMAFTDVVGEGLSADGTFHNPVRTYAYGAAAAHVAVDPRSGKIELLAYVTVEDIGRIINPLTAKGQAIGAVVQGLGGTLLEHLRYDDQGQFLSGSLADYLMPTATDFPNIKAIELELSPSPHNPLGAKGGGEGGIIPVGGVVSNAVAAALAPLGVEPRELPLTPDRIWKLVQKGRDKQ